MKYSDLNKEAILTQLLQVWRDYYDEIFEVDLQTGAFETLMEHDRSRWPISGFAGIEVLILAEKIVHPDDKAAFTDFFDLEGIARRILDDIYVTKLNFRVKQENGDYAWVKVKNIVPTKQFGDDIKFFACFRKIDDEAAADLKYKQELVDALENERNFANEQSRLLTRVSEQIRSPLAGIIGMAALAKTDSKDPNVSAERFAMIESEAVSMNRVLKNLISVGEEQELPEFEFKDRPINEISYGRHHEYENDRHREEYENVIVPEGFVCTGSAVPEFSDASDRIFDFSGKRILLAEGNKLSREVIRNMLASAGAKVDTVNDGKAAVVEFIANPAETYDLILADTSLDEIDGFSVAKCIRISGKEDGEKIPLYALAADATVMEVKKAYKSRFNAFFARPVDYITLFDRMRKEFERVRS